MPVGVAPTDITLEHFKYNILAESTNVFGLALYGAQSKAFQQILKIVKEGIELLVKDVEQLIDFIPVIGSVKGFITAINSCNVATTEGKPCDYFGVILAGVTVMLDVVPGVGELAAVGLKSVGKIFTASRIGAKVIRAGLEVAEEAGAVARGIAEIAEGAAKKGAQRFEEIATPLKEKFAQGWDEIRNCIRDCGKNADRLFSRMQSRLSETIESAAKRMDDFIVRVKEFGKPAGCALRLGAEYVGKAVVSEISEGIKDFTLDYVHDLAVNFGDNLVGTRASVRAKNSLTTCDMDTLEK
jgi:hypothetical protein